MQAALSNNLHLPSHLSVVERKKLTEVNFYDIADLPVTIQVGFERFKKRYHDRLVDNAQKARRNAASPTELEDLRLAHTKGRLKGSETAVFKILLSLLFREMERLRSETPKQYEFLLSKQMDSICVTTNREQIKTMSQGEIRSVSTVSNALNRLRHAGIIVRTRHTSRTVHRATDNEGKETKLVVMRQGGRGNFQLFITKEILSWKYDLTNFSRTKTQLADNQLFLGVKNEILEQPHEVLIETLKRGENNGGNREETSRQSRQPFSWLPSSDGRNENGNEALGGHGAAGGGGAVVRTLEPAEAAEMLSQYKADGGKRGENYRAAFAKDRSIEEKLPQNEPDLFAAQLWVMAKAMIFAHFSPQHLQQVTIHAIRLLKLHLLRLEMALPDAFEVLSYALQRQAEQLGKGGKVYAPMTYLNPDLDYKGGTLRFVVDKWLIEGEFARLDRRNMQYEKQVRWNYAYAFSRKLFKELSADLAKSGFSLVAKRFANDYYGRRLEDYFTKNGIGDKAKTTIRKKFADRATALLTGLEKLPQEAAAPDPTYKAFQAWRKTKKQAEKIA